MSEKELVLAGLVDSENFGEAWDAAYLAALREAKEGDPRLGIPTKQDLEGIRKRLRSLLQEKGSFIYQEELQKALQNGGKVTVHSGTGLSISITVPSVAPIKGLLKYEQKMALYVKKALLLGEPQKAEKLLKKLQKSVPEGYEALWDLVAEAAKIRGHLVATRCSRECGYNPKKREFLFPPPCMEKVVQKTVVFTPSGVKTMAGWHSVSKLKSLFGPDIWAEWVESTEEPKECPHTHRTEISPYLPFSEPDANPRTPDHFPEDIIAVPGEDGSWRRLVHSPGHGLESDESLE